MPMDINSNYINYTSQTNYKNQTDKTKDNEEKQKHISAKDYEKSLFEKFEYLGKQTSMEGVPVNVSVSPAYIRKCANDPEQAKYLEENLKDIPNSVKSLCDYVKCATGGAVVTFANISIDANGNITCQSGSTNDPDGKIAKENAERKAKEQKAKKEKLEKKRAEEKEAEKRAEEKENGDNSTFNITVKGTDIKTVTKQIMSNFSSISVGTSKLTSVDVKV